MIEIGPMTEYDGDVAEKLGVLRRQLSTKYDGSPLPRETLEDIIESPYHDLLLAVDGDEVVGMVVVSIVMMTTRRNVYMEDLVVDENRRGQGIGGDMLEAVKDWGRKKGCQEDRAEDRAGELVDHGRQDGIRLRLGPAVALVQEKIRALPVEL